MRRYCRRDGEVLQEIPVDRHRCRSGLQRFHVFSQDCDTSGGAIRFDYAPWSRQRGSNHHPRSRSFPDAADPSSPSLHPAFKSKNRAANILTLLKIGMVALACVATTCTARRPVTKCAISRLWTDPGPSASVFRSLVEPRRPLTPLVGLAGIDEQWFADFSHCEPPRGPQGMPAGCAWKAWPSRDALPFAPLHAP